MAQLERPNLKETLQEVLDWFKDTEEFRAGRHLTVRTVLEAKLKELVKEESEWQTVATSVEVRKNVAGHVIEVRVQIPR